MSRNKINTPDLFDSLADHQEWQFFYHNFNYNNVRKYNELLVSLIKLNEIIPLLDNLNYQKVIKSLNSKLITKIYLFEISFLRDILSVEPTDSISSISSPALTFLKTIEINYLKLEVRRLLSLYWKSARHANYELVCFWQKFPELFDLPEIDHLSQFPHQETLLMIIGKTLNMFEF